MNTNKLIREHSSLFIDLPTGSVSDDVLILVNVTFLNKTKISIYKLFFRHTLSNVNNVSVYTKVICVIFTKEDELTSNLLPSK